MITLQLSRLGLKAVNILNANDATNANMKLSMIS